MQLNPVYLYSNKVDVFTNLDSWTLERYRKVYQRNFKVFRGIDNRLDLQVRNSDQKPKDMTGYTLVFNLVDRESQKLLINKDCSVVSLANGKVFVTITEADLNDIDTGFYNYSIYAVQNSTRTKLPLYTDSQFDVIGTIEVSNDIFGDTKPSDVIDNFGLIPSFWPNDGTSRSELSYASPEISSTKTIHTFAIYHSNFLGTIDIEASLETGGTPGRGKWTTVSTTVDPTQPIFYRNVEGKWNWFRIRYTPDRDNEGTIDKVLYR